MEEKEEKKHLSSQKMWWIGRGERRIRKGE